MGCFGSRAPVPLVNTSHGLAVVSYYPWFGTSGIDPCPYMVYYINAYQCMMDSSTSKMFFSLNSVNISKSWKSIKRFQLISVCSKWSTVGGHQTTLMNHQPTISRHWERLHIRYSSGVSTVDALGVWPRFSAVTCSDSRNRQSRSVVTLLKVPKRHRSSQEFVESPWDRNSVI